MRSRIKAFFRRVFANNFERELLTKLDWPLMLLVLGIALFGVVCIFSATTTEVTETPETIMDMLETQPVTYARLQLIWILAGLVAMSAVIFFDYAIYETYASMFYAVNLIMLIAVLGMEAGRGGMTAFFSWGSDRGFQPSELGKVAIIIALAKAFAVRTKTIMRLGDVIPLTLYVGLPLVLIVLQPDVGTALVYIAIFAIMVFVSGTSYKLILGVIAVGILMLIPLWYFMNNSSSDSFRFTRILIWLDPESYPDDARQVINAQIAVGSGGLFGKGIVSPGSFASLGYISDDHTDFIFAVCCESFGMVGAMGLVIAYALLLLRLMYLANSVESKFGSYAIMGVMAMFLFHVVENICMVIGLLPVTGIPLPLVSYGGSNMLTNMTAIGLVQNIVMRDRYAKEHNGLSDVNISTNAATARSARNSNRHGRHSRKTYGLSDVKKQ